MNILETGDKILFVGCNHYRFMYDAQIVGILQLNNSGQHELFNEFHRKMKVKAKRDEISLSRSERTIASYLSTYK